MKPAVLVPLEEYLSTPYQPDCDYVDGEVLERNLGEKDHSDLQTEFAYYFRARRRKWKAYAYVEQRVQVAERRFRIPDVCVVIGEKPKDQVFRTPPFICIEVLSPEDRMSRVQDRIDDYLKFGVPYVWLIDPASRRAWIYTKNGIHEAVDGILKTENPELIVPLAEIFTGIDE
jgi:Uma2 family endonuclease